MKLHSSSPKIDAMPILLALNAAKKAGHVGTDVYFVQLEPAGTRTRNKAWNIQLGSNHKRGRLAGGTEVKRRPKNTGVRGSDGQFPFAATWHEWGFFIAEIFRLDPEAVFGPYKGAEDFHEQTRYQFHPTYRSAMDAFFSGMTAAAESMGMIVTDETSKR